MIRLRSLCLLSVACALVTLDAPAQPQQAKQPATALDETIEVRLLEADVVVQDADGKPVHGLTQGDFVVLEDGAPQPITNFTEYRESASASLPGSPSPAAAATSRPAPRTLALLLDAMTLRGRAREEFFAEIRTLVGRAVREGDRVVILNWAQGTFRPALDLTTDRRAIAAAIDQVEKSPAVLAATGPSITTREAELRAVAEASTKTVAGVTVAMEPYDPNDLLIAKRMMADDELMQMQARTAALQHIVSSFTGSSGRTVVVYASEHFPRIAGKRAFVGLRPGSSAPSFDESLFDTRRLIASVVAAANASGVAFYAVYPQIPSTAGSTLSIEEERMVVNRVLDSPDGQDGTDAMSDQLILQNDVEALQQLTSQTGGTLGVGPGGVKDVVEQIVTDVGSYYSLGWRAQSDGTDRERRIAVRTKNPAWTVRTRTSLVEKSDRTRAEDLLIAQLYERGSAGELELDVDIRVPERLRKERTSIPIELTIPVDQLEFVGEEPARAAKFTVLMIAGARSGEATRITRDTRSLPAGGRATTDGVVRYTLAVVVDPRSSVVSIGVFDENSGQVGIRTIVLADGRATVSTPPPSSIANEAWREAFDRAVAQRKPLVVFFRPKRCKRCDELERSSLAHPAVAQRARNVAFAVVNWPPSGRPPAVWPSMQPGIGLFDPSGALRAEWRVVPDTMALGRIFDGAIASSPNFQRAAALTKSGGPHAGAVEHAVGLLKLGFNGQARAVLEETAANGNPLQRQRAMTALAPLDAREGRVAEAMATLASVRAEPVSPEVAAEAAFATGVLARHHGSDAEAQEAFRAAIALTGADSPVGRAASAEMALVAGVIRIVPLIGEVISGMQLVRTVVSSPAIARVVFTLDGTDSTTVTAPPYSTAIQFGRLPVPHRVRVVAHDANGAEVGRDELTVNAAGNVFWVKVTEPPSGKASGEVAVNAELRAPAGHRVRSVALSWNDAPLATLAAEPWRSVVRIPEEVGVLRATATLDDGRTAEDAVLLNGTGHTERMDVQLLQLPVTVMPPGSFTPADIVVKEGATQRTVESVVPGSEAALTVGLIIDTSSSMQMDLDEVQEAALRFLDTALGPSDHAFLISFDSSARLVAAPTADRQRLRNALLTLLPNGYTALHDAIVLGLMQMEGIEGRRALLVFTDGDDTSSRYSAAEVAELSRRSNVPIYLISPRLEGRSRDVVKAARASGGRSYEVSGVAKLGPIYDAIAEALRAQMLVTIRSAPAVRPNEWREITVEIAGRGLDVRAPAGYYAPR